MDRTVKQTLDLLRLSMQDEGPGAIDLTDADWNGISRLGEIHHIIPMLYCALSRLHALELLPTEISGYYGELSLGTGVNQLRRTMRFLKVYDLLNRAGIVALAVKGLVCRQLYPDRYYRFSCDEDVYIRVSDYGAADHILLQSGLVRVTDEGHSRQFVATYRCRESGLTVELHTSLFQPGVKFFQNWNALFEASFGNPDTVNIEGVQVHTLSKEKHLLYLILHAMKHFMGSGLGIRQLCDIVMYCNRYGGGIPWEDLWRDAAALGVDFWLLHVFDIGMDYLGLREENIRIPDSLAKQDTDSGALLEDIMESGIFGGALPGQDKAGILTLQSAMSHRRCTLLRCVFPHYEYMKGHYAYCAGRPYLLPLAWLHRLGVYIKAEAGSGEMLYRTRCRLSAGQQRMKLMEEYKILEAGSKK